MAEEYGLKVWLQFFAQNASLDNLARDVKKKLGKVDVEVGLSKGAGPSSSASSGPAGGVGIIQELRNRLQAADKNVEHAQTPSALKTALQEQKQLQNEMKKQTKQDDGGIMDILGGILKALAPVAILLSLQPVADVIKIMVGLAAYGILKIIDGIVWLGTLFGDIATVFKDAFTFEWDKLGEDMVKLGKDLGLFSNDTKYNPASGRVESTQPQTVKAPETEQTIQQTSEKICSAQGETTQSVQEGSNKMSSAQGETTSAVYDYGIKLALLSDKQISLLQQIKDLTNKGKTYAQAANAIIGGMNSSPLTGSTQGSFTPGTVATLSDGRTVQVSEGGALSYGKAQNDFVMRPGQGAVPFSADDTIIGFKGGGAPGGSSKIFNFYGVTPQEMLDVIKRELNVGALNYTRF